MTAQEAKQVLLAYRPWANDDQEPEMAEALALCREDPELSQWLTRHCATQMALRERMQGIKPPEGLLQQIVSERRTWEVKRQETRHRLVVIMAGLIIVVSGWFIWKSVPRTPRQDLSFDGYRNRLARTVARAYGMDLETGDRAVIRAHLVTNQAPADFTTSEALNQTSVVGCGVLRWQDKPVSMVCYRTGKVLPPGMKSDLILFVARQADVKGSADLSDVKFNKASEWFMASWRAGGQVYLLAALDEAELRKRL